MLLAEGLTWLEWGLLGTVLLCTAIVVSRAFRGGGGQTAQTDDEPDDVDMMAGRRVASLEVRLHDFAREVEARLEKRGLELDALVTAADREIVRLSDLLKRSSPAKDPRGPDITRPAARSGSAPDLSAAQEQMICHLHGAGYTVSEIAHMVGRPPEAVDSVLKAA
jgi:hypothetical protein